MRALLWTVIVAFAAWSGWWWFASSSARTAAETAFTEARAQGWAAGHGGIAVAGYPNRVDLTITRPELSPPEGRWGWRAPFLQLFALSYKPWHVIAAFPPEQEIDTPAGPVTLRAAKLQSSLVLVPGMDLPLDRSQIVGEDLTLTAAGGAISAATLSLASRQAAAANAHDLGLDVAGLTLPPALQARLPAGLLTAGEGKLYLDAEARLDAPLDRHAVQTHPQLTQLVLRNATASWGSIRLSLTGTLVPDAEGRAEGTLTLELAGGAELLAAAEALGLVAPELQRNLMMVLAMSGGGQKPLSLPLILRGGQTRLGPIPLGPAPRLTTQG